LDFLYFRYGISAPEYPLTIVIYEKNNETFTFNGNAEECLNEITGENYEQ